MSETDPDEDIHAVDCHLQYPEVALPVQVKCSSRHELAGKDPFVDVTPKWAQKWSAVDAGPTRARDRP